MEKNYSLKQVAEILGLKIRTVREWVKTGKLKASKYDVSNRWFVTESEIQRVKGSK